MSTENDLYPILANIQKKIKAPKTHYNKFGEFYGRKADDILKAIRPYLNGAIVTVDSEIIHIGDRYYVKATAKIYKNGKEISATAFAREDLEKKKLAGAQITGLSTTYAKKYALENLFLVDDNKDYDQIEEDLSQAPTIPFGKKQGQPVRKMTDDEVDSAIVWCKEVLESDPSNNKIKEFLLALDKVKQSRKKGSSS